MAVGYCHTAIVLRPAAWDTQIYNKVFLGTKPDISIQVHAPMRSIPIFFFQQRMFQYILSAAAADKPHLLWRG